MEASNSHFAERGCVEDQPQRGMTTETHRKLGTCCGWSRTTQPRSGQSENCCLERRVLTRWQLGNTFPLCKLSL